MAVKTNYNYTDFDVPYNNFLERTDTIPSSSIPSVFGDDLIQNPGNMGENVLDGQSIDNLEIKSWIKSANYRPKTHGFIIDGQLGYIECMQLYVGSGGIVGGSLDIPDYTSVNSFHVDPSGNTWWGISTSGPISSAPAYILNTGEAKFTNITVTIQPGSTGVANLSDAGDLALQDDITDAQAPYSLRGWTNNIQFTASDYNTVIWSAGTIKFSNGTTFSINAGTTGNMTLPTYIYFNGVSNNLQVTSNYATAIGSGYVLVCFAKPNSDILKYAFFQAFGGSGDIAVQPIITADNIVSNYIYTNELAANQIVAGSGIINNLTIKSVLTMGDGSTTGTIQSYGWDGIASGFQIKGGTSPGLSIIGGNIRTAATGQHMVLNNSNLTGYYLTTEIPANKGMQLDYDSLEFYTSPTGARTISYDPDGITFWEPGTTNKRGRFWTDGSYYYIDAGYNSLYGLLFRTAEVSGNNLICSMNYVGGVGIFKMQGASQRIESNRISIDTHLNFGYSTSGDSGYGIRQNSGTMEFKDSGDPSWTAFSSVGGEVNTASSAGGTYGLYYTKVGVDLRFKGLTAGTGISITNNGTYLTLNATGGLPSGTTLNMMYFDGFNWGNTTILYVGGLSGGNISYSGGRIVSNKDFVANPGSLHATGNLYTGGVSGSSGSLNAAQWNIGTSSYINWNVGNANVYIDDDIYINGKLKQLDTSIILNGVTYSRKLMSTVVPGGTGYILHSSV